MKCTRLPIGRVWTVLMVLAVALLGHPRSARAQGTGAEISGTVTDPAGNALPGVKVTLTNQDTGVTRVVTAGADGRYVFVDLPNGRYSLRFEQSGFATTEINDLVLNIGAHIAHRVHLQMSAVQHHVNVAANS